MPNLTPEGLRRVAEVAARHRVSLEAAFALLDSLTLGNGRQAQFDHPDLGGMGQWSQGGMIMIGDMFNQALKHKVDALCSELAGLLGDQPSIQQGSGQSQSQTGGGGVSLFVQGPGSGGAWWPAELGHPASSGAQNDMRYAFFPGPRRIAIQQGGRVRVYDSGEHRLSGFSQQQGGDQSLTFASQFGTLRIADLPLVSAEGETPQSESPPTPTSASPTPSPLPSPQVAPAAVSAAPIAVNEILSTIEGLAGLRQKNIITEEEFAAKKAELLSRL